MLVCLLYRQDRLELHASFLQLYHKYHLQGFAVEIRSNCKVLV